MAVITEIAPDLFRISVYVPPPGNLQFNHFLVRDEEPLLFHTGLRAMFPEVRAAVASLIEVAELRWISWSHFESDECGALNDWLAVAPNAEAACSMLGALVNVNDFAAHPARGLSPEDMLVTGRCRFRYHPTPHLPHGWDAGVLFEETNRTLLCSDLFHQNGNLEPLTHDDVVGRTRESLREYQQGLLADYQPPTPHTDRVLESLAALNPRTLAIMHGSSFAGDGARALRGLGQVLRETFEEPHPRWQE